MDQEAERNPENGNTGDGNGKPKRETEASFKSGTVTQLCAGDTEKETKTHAAEVEAPDEIKELDTLAKECCIQANKTENNLKTIPHDASDESDNTKNLKTQSKQISINEKSVIKPEWENRGDVLNEGHYVTGEVSNREGQVEERVSYIPDTSSGPIGDRTDVSSIIALVAQRNLNCSNSSTRIPEEQAGGLSENQSSDESNINRQSSMEVLSPQTSPKEVSNPQPSSTEVASTQSSQAEVASTQLLSMEVASTQHESSGIVSTQLTSTDAASPQPSVAEVSSTQLSSTDAASPHLSQAEVASTQMSSTDNASPQPSVAEVSSTQLPSTDAASPQPSQAEVASTQMSSTDNASPQPSQAEVASTQLSSTDAVSPQPTQAEVPRTQQSPAKFDDEIINFRKVVQDFLDGIKDQMPTEDPPETTESLAAFVQENIASKNIRTIRYTLKSLTEADRNAVVEYEIDGKTAMFLACEKGTGEMVRYFVVDCGADVNKKGMYDCGGKVMSVAPLWLATIEEKPDVVDVLASNGANVNAVCTTGSTAVHAACYMNNKELVEVLCNNGGDVNIPDTMGSTCLKDSVDNFEICKILISHNADVNYKKENQYSILHHAIKAHNLETVELLVRNGANIMTQDFEGNDCLRYAVLIYSPDIVEFLLDSIHANAPKSADVYDLMGAMAASRGEYKEAYEYWLRSMYIRTELHGGDSSLKEVPEIFGKDIEVPRSISDLILLAKNCDAMDGLALSIMSDQLGLTNSDTIQRILLQSTSLLHNENLIQAFDMTRYVYALLINKYKILHRMQEFALSQLFEICSKFQIQTLRGVAIPRFKEILEVFRDMADFLEKAYLLKHTDTEYFIQNSSVFDKVIAHLFDMIYLLKVNNRSAEEKFFFKSQMKRLVDLEMCDVNGASLLHQSLTRKPKVMFHFMEVGPREARHEDLCVTRELIKAGADVNVQDLKRDTPLHSHLKWIEKYNFFTKKIIELFLEYGVHVDLVDIDNTSLLEMINARGLMLCPVKYHTLQCLAVKVILDKRILFRSQLPIPIQRFVDMHK
ncbi:protein fem-1 homolog C-like [Argopecten irradians]|uniref:protein fem-1 homolog C-like n=1 Tax=Argopecten irradians TaxID=31199 RepID=UPI003718ED4B